MNRHYAYTSQIWPSVCILLLLVALAIYAWRRRKTPGALPFIIACLFAAAWAAGSVMEYAAVDWTTKIFWVKFQASWLLPLVTSIICFSLEYAWPRRWLTSRNLVLFSLPSLVVLGLILMDHLNHVMWRGFAFLGSVQPQFAPVGWFAVVFGLVIPQALNLIIFGWLFLHSPQHRWPVAFMLVGQFGGRLFFLAERTNLLHSILPIDLIGMAFEFLMYAIALFGFQILDPIPLARQTAIMQLPSGMLVLDPQGKIISLNPAAEWILGAPTRQVKGRPVRELLPAYPQEQLADSGETQVELSLTIGQEIRHYETVISLLKDFRGLVVGHLLLLHDVTEQKRTQAQILEQQRALAMLHEREQLARELHDNLGQVFAFVNAQGQTIRRLLGRGDVATAEAYVDRLVEVAREADVDIRESILGLRATISEQGLFPALTQYLTKYEKNYGIQTRLEGSEMFTDGAIEPLVEVHLLRILQEALTNVRKHANAGQVRIAFSSEDGWARVIVHDDGRGFDPGTSSSGSEEHVGLRVMRERAEEVGGSLNLHSALGQGTELVVRVPVKGANLA